MTKAVDLIRSMVKGIVVRPCPRHKIYWREGGANIAPLTLDLGARQR
jgi:hypothetical protein